MKAKEKKPELHSITPEQAQKVIVQINASSLPSETKDIIIKSMQFNLWLSDKLQNSRHTISGLLKKLFSKFKTEKNPNKRTKEKKPKSDPKSSEDSAKPKPKKKKGHGRRSAASFDSAKIIKIALAALKAGDPCPLCPPTNAPSLYSIDPGILLFFHGESPIQPFIVELQALRCSNCGSSFKAPIPNVLSKHSRTTPEAKALVVFLKYKGGIPFYRLEMLQASLGARISDSEIWEMAESAAIHTMPAYLQLHQEAAKAEIVLVDDTSMPVLNLMKENDSKKKAQEKLKEELASKGKKGGLEEIRG